LEHPTATGPFVICEVVSLELEMPQSINIAAYKLCPRLPQPLLKSYASMSMPQVQVPTPQPHVAQLHLAFPHPLVSFALSPQGSHEVAPSFFSVSGTLQPHFAPQVHPGNLQYGFWQTTTSFAAANSVFALGRGPSAQLQQVHGSQAHVVHLQHLQSEQEHPEQGIFVSCWVK
jgi:hypothetical protein